MAKSLKVFVDIGCKVIICATRTRGQTVEEVHALADEYDVKWLEKSRPADKDERDAANRATAREILALVRSAIDACTLVPVLHLLQ